MGSQFHYCKPVQIHTVFGWKEWTSGKVERVENERGKDEASKIVARSKFKKRIYKEVESVCDFLLKRFTRRLRVSCREWMRN